MLCISLLIFVILLERLLPVCRCRCLCVVIVVVPTGNVRIYNNKYLLFIQGQVIPIYNMNLYIPHLPQENTLIVPHALLLNPVCVSLSLLLLDLSVAQTQM